MAGSEIGNGTAKHKKVKSIIDLFVKIDEKEKV